MLGSATALLLALESWLRTVFVLTGAALALALGSRTSPSCPWWRRPAPGLGDSLAGVVLVGGPLLAGLVPAARQIEGVAAQSLLGVEFPDGRQTSRRAGRSAAGPWAGSCCTCSLALWSWPPC